MNAFIRKSLWELLKGIIAGAIAVHICLKVSEEKHGPPPEAPAAEEAAP